MGSDRDRMRSRPPTGCGSMGTPGSGPASSRSMRIRRPWTRRHRGKASPSHREDKASALGTVGGMATPAQAGGPPPRRCPSLAASEAGGPGPGCSGPCALFFATQPNARGKLCGATRPTRGDDCQPHAPALCSRQVLLFSSLPRGWGEAHVWLSEAWTGGLSPSGSPMGRRAGMAMAV